MRAREGYLMNDAPLGFLRDYPFVTVRMACERCDRQARFNRERLIAEHGADVDMVTMRPLLAGCTRPSLAIPCGAFFPDLALE